MPTYPLPRTLPLGLLAVCTLLGVGWLPFALTLLAFGGHHAYLLALTIIAMAALPATALAWVIRSTHRTPRIIHLMLVDVLYVFVIAYHGAIGWLTLGAPITPWLIAYHCLACVSLSAGTIFFAALPTRESVDSMNPAKSP